MKTTLKLFFALLFLNCNHNSPVAPPPDQPHNGSTYGDAALLVYSRFADNIVKVIISPDTSLFSEIVTATELNINPTEFTFQHPLKRTLLIIEFTDKNKMNIVAIDTNGELLSRDGYSVKPQEQYFYRNTLKDVPLNKASAYGYINGWNVPDGLNKGMRPTDLTQVKFLYKPQNFAASPDEYDWELYIIEGWINIPLPMERASNEQHFSHQFNTFASNTLSPDKFEN